METTEATNTTETVNPNPGEETGTTLTAELVQYTCSARDCWHEGPVEEFKAPDFRVIINHMLKELEEANQSSEERVVVTPEQVVKYAVCNECASKEKSYRLYPLAGSLDRSRQFQQRNSKVTDVMGPPKTPTAPIVPLDPEAATPVACWVCGHEQPRADAVIMGWLGAQLIAAARLRKQDPTERRPLVHVSSEMLLGTEKDKSLVTCRGCAPQVRQALADVACGLREIADLSGQDQERELKRRLGFYPLMMAISASRRKEEEKMVSQQREAELEETRVKEEQARQASIADLFQFKAQDRTNNGGRNNGRNGNGKSGKGKRNGRWDNDE